jgi:hypothetical protein
VLLAAVREASPGDLATLADRLAGQGVHDSHYIMVRLQLRYNILGVRVSDPTRSNTIRDGQ